MAGELFVMRPEFLVTDISVAFFMLLGTVMLIGFLRLFGGERLKKYSIMIGAGMLLFSMLHEVGELMCGSGIHGGYPQTTPGSIHVFLLGIIGPLLFFMGCYLFQKKYFKYVEGK